MANGMTRKTFRELCKRDRMIDLIIRDAAALTGRPLTDELPAEKTFAELVAKAGGRVVSL